MYQNTEGFLIKCIAGYALAFPSFITPTQAAPIIKNTPANTSIFTSGAMLPSVVNIFNTRPPNEAATIYGTQMVPLNKPRYVPIWLPLNALVKMVKGNANIAAHAQPINKNEANKAYWSWMNRIEMKPTAPKSKLTT